MARITQKQEDKLEGIAIIEGPNYPYGDDCPECGRPHLFTYTDGTRLCAKCGELVTVGKVLD